MAMARTKGKVHEASHWLRTLAGLLIFCLAIWLGFALGIGGLPAPFGAVAALCWFVMSAAFAGSALAKPSIRLALGLSALVLVCGAVSLFVIAQYAGKDSTGRQAASPVPTAAPRQEEASRQPQQQQPPVIVADAPRVDANRGRQAAEAAQRQPAERQAAERQAAEQHATAERQAAAREAAARQAAELAQPKAGMPSGFGGQPERPPPIGARPATPPSVMPHPPPAPPPPPDGPPRQAMLPQFPWPPPAASASYVLPTDLLQTHRTVGEVAAAIISALERNGYVERSFFRTEAGGVALVTRLERINDDGSSVTGSDRWWAGEKNPVSADSLVRFLRGLFFVDPGHYRVIVFVLQDLPFSQSSRETFGEEARAWLRTGANILPSEVAGRPFGEGNCTVLIYEFASDGSAVRVVVSRLTGKQHLEKAGVLSLLASAN